jgi:signal transduction histidine kinase
VKPFSLSELKAMLEVTHYKAKADLAFREMQARAQKLEKAESLARMAGAVAHNYNNALTGVTCNLELALEEIATDAPYRDIIASAHKQSIEAANIGLKMLDYIGQTFSVAENLDVVALCKSYVSGKGDFSDMQTALPDHQIIVCSNPDHICHVLDVLVSNARESSSEPTGAITFKVGQKHSSHIPAKWRVPMDFEPADAVYAYLEVADTGCGIEPNEIEKVFEPFYSTKFAGRGLGLASALGLMKASAGCFTVSSCPGKGSVFCVWLPVVGATE